MTLRDEITTDPLGRGYAAMSDQQVVDNLNLADRTRNINVPMRDLVVYLLKSSKLRPIEEESVSGALGVQDECYALIKIMNNVNFSDLDLTDATMRAMLVSISATSLLNAADRTAILAMGTENITRAEEIGAPLHGGRLMIGRVTSARAGA